jgi:hypothetical protein
MHMPALQNLQRTIVRLKTYVFFYSVKNTVAYYNASIVVVKLTPDECTSLSEIKVTRNLFKTPSLPRSTG